MKVKKKILLPGTLSQKVLKDMLHQIEEASHESRRRTQEAKTPQKGSDRTSKTTWKEVRETAVLQADSTTTLLVPAGWRPWGLKTTIKQDIKKKVN